MYSTNLFTHQPVFWAACAYAAGIVAASLAWRPASWWLIASVAFLGFAFRVQRDHTVFATSLSLAVVACLGALHFELSAATQPPAVDITRFTDGNEAVITAHVVRTGLPRGRSGNTKDPERREVIDLETEAIERAAGRQEVAFGIRMTVRSQALPGEEEDRVVEPPSTSFVYGERVRFPAKLREPRNYGNPGAMDYRGYLRDKGILALASVSVEKFEKLEGSRGGAWGRWRSRIRNGVAEQMLSAARPGGSLLSLSPEDAGLVLAMVIGEQSLLERATRAEFQKTGVFHIVVVSGMNVGMLALFVFWVARRLRAGQWVATWSTVISCLAYVAITDLGTPVLRAAIMLCLYLVARLLYRDRFSLNAVGTAAWALLLFAPASIFEPSFQLTFLSMVALSGIVQPLLDATSRPYAQADRGLELTGYDLTLEPRLAQFRLDLRLIVEKIARLAGGRRDGKAYSGASWMLTRSISALLSLYDLLAVSVVMQLSLALPMTIYFHRLALLGVPTNILVVPLTGILMPAALIATLLQAVSSTLASVAWGLTALCLHGITFVVQHASGNRFADVRLAVPTLSAALLAATLFVIALIIARRRWAGALIATALVAIAAAIAIITPQPRLKAAVMEVTAIDVGQGDSILLITPDGKTLLVDGGGPAGPFRTDNFDQGEDVVSPYLWSRGITRLDAVAVTHAHSDHLAGMPAVIANFRPGEVWLGAEAEGERYARLKEVAAQYQVAVRHFATGDRIPFGLAEIEVLNPPAGSKPSARSNEESLVLQARYRATSALLTGDAEKKTEERLAGSAAVTSLLKVAHHGSGTSTTPELLARTQPQYAVISAGYRNLYGHPRADVLMRLREAHVRVYRTDIEGAVTFYLDGTNITAALPGR